MPESAFFRPWGLFSLAGAMRRSGKRAAKWKKAGPWDTAFRLCVVNEREDESGGSVKTVMVLENLNGVTLKKGSDLFQSRLALGENWESAYCQSHENWDEAVSQYRELGAEQQERLVGFLKELNEAPFQYVLEENPEFYTDGKAQAHLFFKMKDGTKVELRLFEGGYVGYQNLGGYFVNMPGQAFDALFEACR